MNWLKPKLRWLLSLCCWKRCPHCQRWSQTVERRRMNTRYVNDEQNWITECDECFEDTESYWADMWDDYYRGCM